MKALVKTTSDHVEIQSIPIPECGANEVLIKVASAALCGTDMHIIAWNSWARNAGITLPFVLGHECCGDVVEVGVNVVGHQVGDKVAVETHIPCGQCQQCLNGKQHICNNLTLFGVNTNGCFAEYTRVPAECARRIPCEINYDLGSMMEPIGTAFRSVLESEVGGCNVLVVGCGPIGLFAVASAKTLGANLTIAADISDYRLKIAREVGADLAFDPRNPEMDQQIRSLTQGYGVDVIIEASGNGKAIKEAFQYLKKGGTMAMIGLPDLPVELNLGKDIVFKEAKVFGIHGRKMFSTWEQVERLLKTNKLDVGAVITHILPLEQWQKGVDLAKRGEACKIIFHP